MIGNKRGFGQDPVKGTQGDHVADLGRGTQGDHVVDPGRGWKKKRREPMQVEVGRTSRSVALVAKKEDTTVINVQKNRSGARDRLKVKCPLPSYFCVNGVLGVSPKDPPSYFEKALVRVKGRLKERIGY